MSTSVDCRWKWFAKLYRPNFYFLLLSQNRLKRWKKDVGRCFLTFALFGSATLSVIICSPCFRPKSGSMLLYSRKKVRYRRDGYCWKKRKDGKTTREDHMKLKVQGTEVSLSFQTLLVWLPIWDGGFISFSHILSRLWYVVPRCLPPPCHFNVIELFYDKASSSTKHVKN